MFRPRVAGLLRGTHTSMLEERLEEHFNRIMKCDRIPLLSNFDVYKKSLPVRNPGIINSKQYPLYQLPIWLHDEDVDKLSDQLLAESSARNVVNYISAPSHFGKTACVLPAFLNSTVKENGFTHYLYLSCDNNNSNYFCSDRIINENNAECQGASFIFECLKILLTASSAQLPHRITVNEHPPTSDESVNKLRKLFADMAPNDETSPRILVHIDEHRKMCPRNESSYRNETRMCEGDTVVVSLDECDDGDPESE